MDSNTFNRTLYSDDDGNFEIEYDPSVKYVSFIRNRKLNNMEYVQLSVNTFKILVKMLDSPYHTFEIRIDQPGGYAHLFNYWSDNTRFGGSNVFMVRTINGLNKNEFHITQDIAHDIYFNSSRIEGEILDMDKNWNNNEKLNKIFTPDLKLDESLGTGYEGEDECEQTWKDALSRLLNEIKYSSLPNRIQRLVSFVIAHQLLPRQIPYNVLRLIKDNYRYLEYLNSSVNVITLGSNEKCSERDVGDNVITLESDVNVQDVIEDYGVSVINESGGILMIMKRGEVKDEILDSVSECTESKKGDDESSESEYPNSENCNCSLCTPHLGEVTESDGSDVDECDCVGFGNNIVSEHE